MALFNRFLTHVQRKKEPAPKELSLWKEHYDILPDNGNFDTALIHNIWWLICTGHVRVILFRECDRKGKKLLFDSNTVERHELTGNFEEDNLELYTEVGEGVGFKYLRPPYKDVKIISEMIFGSAAVAYQSSNMKIHQLENERQMMWSSVVQAPRITRGVKASDQSLGSSFGCSFGSFNVNEHNGNQHIVF